MQNKNLKELLNIFKKREFNFWQTNIENNEEMEIKVKLGKIKDMSKDKITLTKLYDMMVGFVEETRQNFDQVNDRLDRLETRMDNLEKRVENIEKDVSVLKSDVALIKCCPTIKKELDELNSSK